MDPFWSNIYDGAKDRRYGGLFFATCIIVVAGATIAGLVQILTVYPEVNPILVVCLALLAMLILAGAAILCRRSIRMRRMERLNFSNLSRDELFKARSKLKSRMNPVKFRAVVRPAKQRMPPRARDIDIKY